MDEKEKIKLCDYEECENPYVEASPVFKDEKCYHLTCWIKNEIDKKMFEVIDNHENQFH